MSRPHRRAPHDSTLAAALVAALVAALPLARPSGAQPEPPLPLVPLPREATTRPGFPVGRGIAVVRGGDPADRFAADDLAETLRARGLTLLASPAAGGVRVRLLRRGTRAGDEVLRRAGLAF